MSTRRRNSPNSSNASNKLRLDSLNKILKIDVSKNIRKHKKDTIAKQASTIALSELIRSTPNRLQNVPDFKVFLTNKENIQLFRDFLKTQYCHENLDFYLACEKYRYLNPEKVGDVLIKLMATQIYNDYLAENARQPVNVDNNCKERIARQIRSPNLNLFVEAQTEIFNLMRADCYPRFCKTWQLDKETARRILCERAIDPPLNKKVTKNDTHSTTMTSTSCDLSLTSLNSTKWSLSSRDLKRKIAPQTNNVCPSDCPYTRIGLPCQQHDNRVKQQKGSSDLIDTIDMTKLHHVPKNIPNRSPPPPPLPSTKPKQYHTRSSPVAIPEAGPYIGKVFHV